MLAVMLLYVFIQFDLHYELLIRFPLLYLSHLIIFLLFL